MFNIRRKLISNQSIVANVSRVGEGIGPTRPGVSKNVNLTENYALDNYCYSCCSVAVGLIGGIGGSLIHALLVIAAIVLIYNLISGRRILS